MIPILFEDDDILAIEKPEGLASIPEGDPARPSLLSILSARFPHKLYVVHRLDKDVSGAIRFAKHPEAHRHLNEQFSQRRVHKTYLALAHGVVEVDQDVIDGRLRQYGSGRMGVDPVRGKRALTEFQVLERFFGHNSGKDPSRHRPPPPDPRTPLLHRPPHRRRQALRRSSDST